MERGLNFHCRVDRCPEADLEINSKNDKTSVSRKVSKNKLKVLYCNARSVRNKMDELKGIVALEDIDIIGITESWANKDDLMLLDINGFIIFRQDRFEKKGGGVLIYIKNHLSCKELKISIKLNDLESVWIELTNPKGKNLVIGNVYRPPNTGIEQDKLLCEHIKEACRTREVILMGDFNFPNIDWGGNFVCSERERGNL